MQRTITEQVAPKAEQAEPEFLRRIRTDPRICSVVTVRSGGPGKVTEPHGLAHTGRSKLLTSNADSFFVTDLLEDIMYMVGQDGALSKIVFTLKNEQVIVTVQPGSDLIEIAHDFAIRMATITAHN